MRITRKIPGIRLPIPGRQDESTPGIELFSPGWAIALVYAFLLAALGIYLLCTLRFGGHLTHFWLETRVLGFSLYAIASGVNALLIVYTFVAFLSARRKGSPRSWNKGVSFLFALGLLGCVQVFLSGWKNMARWDHETSQAGIEGHTRAVDEIRAKIADLGEHAWVGEYVSQSRYEEKRLLLAPDKTACQVFQLHSYSEKGLLHERAGRFHSVSGNVAIEKGRLLLQSTQRRGDDRYAMVAWGERRYLVASETLDDFLAQKGAPAAVDGVYLRIGDETRPVAGRPTVVEDLH